MTGVSFPGLCLSLNDRLTDPTLEGVVGVLGHAKPSTQIKPFGFKYMKM